MHTLFTRRGGAANNNVSSLCRENIQRSSFRQASYTHVCSACGNNRQQSKCNNFFLFILFFFAFAGSSLGCIRICTPPPHHHYREREIRQLLFEPRYNTRRPRLKVKRTQSITAWCPPVSSLSTLQIYIPLSSKTTMDVRLLID